MDINEKFELLLSEGVRDKGIFKAVFINGGPGSGKDYVMKKTLHDHGLIEIPSDKAHDYITGKDKLDIENNKPKNVKELRQKLAINGRNGLIINGTGDDHTHTKTIKKGLEKLGYDTSMIHVHADDEVSKKRNIERAKMGGRAIPERNRKEKWDNVQYSRPHHAKMFGDKYHEFDNSEDLRDAPPELIKQKKDELSDIHDHIANFVNSPSSSPVSQKWIDKEIGNSSTPVPRKGTEKLPHPNSNASKQAKELGLQYFGSGRYGKSGKITHHSIQDNLTEIDKEKPKNKPKKLSEMFSKSVSNTLIKENVNIFSDEQDSLTLGKKVEAFGEKNEGICLSNDDISKILSEDLEVQKLKKTLKRKNFHELRKSLNIESIDKGIESGCSMATGGESLARPSAEVIKKDGKSGRKTKEWSQKINELTGDTTTASIGAEKEDELKKKGINILTFRSKNYI